MKQAENLFKQVPYTGIPMLARLGMSLLEAPGGAITFGDRIRNRGILSTSEAQSILFEAVDRLDGALADNLKSSPRIGKYLGRGFEATVFALDTKDGKWVMKIGLPKSCVPGIYSPSTDKYAAMMKWNYTVLQKTFSRGLPHMLPNPYFVVTPSELGRATTVQFLPYVEKIADMDVLTAVQKLHLIEERQKFYDTSKLLIAKNRVMPDLVGPRNLILGMVENDPHYHLIDLGLFHLRAPTPILNLLVYSFQRASLIKDVSTLKCQAPLLLHTLSLNKTA